MTNKELIKKVYDKLGITKRAEYNLITNEDKEIVETFINIEKELEMLELITNHIDMRYVDNDFPDFSIMFYDREKEECKKLKTWLKRKKINGEKCSYREAKFSDLRDGRIVVFKNEYRYLIIKNRLYAISDRPSLAAFALENRDYSDITLVCDSTTEKELVKNIHWSNE